MVTNLKGMYCLEDFASLTLPRNRGIISTYIQEKAIDMAGRFLELMDEPFSEEIIQRCFYGSYDPLSSIETLDNVIQNSSEILQKKYPAVYDAIMGNITEMKDEYRHIAAATNILAPEETIDYHEAICDPNIRDNIIRLAFSDREESEVREKVEDCFQKLFFQYQLFKLIKPAIPEIRSTGPAWKKMADLIEKMPVEKADWLQEKATTFAVIEANRLYGSDPGF